MQLDDWQEEFLQIEGDKALCCGRQIGKSEICARDAAEWAIRNKNQVILMIAPLEKQAFALFTKTLRYLEAHYPKIISKGKKRPTQSKINLVNGVEIWCLPVGMTGLGVRFATIGRLYVDEASRIPEIVWSAVEPLLLTTGGDTILLSTGHGSGNFFANVVKNIDQAYGSFKVMYGISSEEVVRKRAICDTWTEFQREKALKRLENAKKRMTALQYAQEYLGIIVDEFRQVFPDELIRKCMLLKRRGSILKNRQYYLGVDIARMGEDESTFEIIEKMGERLEHVESQITRKTLTTETTERILQLDGIYSFRQIFVDDGGMGVGVFDQLLTTDRTKRKTIAINNTARPLDREEKKKKRTMKEDIFNNMLMLMEQGRLKLLDDPEIFQSLKSVQFEIDDRGKARYFGNYTHIADGLVRACWCSTKKDLNPVMSWR